MNFTVGFATDIGRRRQQNQDHGAVFPDAGLFIVADGMGGHRGGETASAMAVEVIAGVVKDDPLKSQKFPKEAIAEAIQKANGAIFEKSLNEPMLQGMGTTTTLLFFAPQENSVGDGKANLSFKDLELSSTRLFVGHVGDSRCYYLSQHEIWQVTRDHSLVQEKLRAGMITREQIKTDRMKNVITRSVGFEPPVSVDIYEIQPQAGDLFLICSDGLSGLIEDHEILKVIDEAYSVTGEAENKAQKATEALISRANDNGGDDNITAILVQVNS